MIKKSFFVMFLLYSLTANPWTNWPGNYSCNGTIMHPKTKEDLITTITNSIYSNKKIRVVGTGHSLNDIACSNDILISLDNLTEIIAIDQHKREITVQAGITLEQLSLQLAQHGLSLPNFISTTAPTLGGAICTASHGTGHTGSLSSFVREIELITADGSIHSLSLNKNKSEFQAACASLGALGVLYSITIQCEPLFKVEYHTVSLSIDEITEQYTQLQRKNNFFQFRWNTKTDIALAEFWNRVTFDTVSSESVRYSYESLPCERGQAGKPVLCSEIAIAIEMLPQAVMLLKPFIKKWQQKGIAIPFVNGRFVKADTNALLSPSANYDVVYLNINNPADQDCLPMYRDFEQIMYTIRGRPHWGKNNFMNYEKALLLYGQNLLTFIEVKNNLDPQNHFSNAYIDQILFSNNMDH